MENKDKKSTFDKVFSVVYYLFLGVLGVIALLLIFSIAPIPGNYSVMIVKSGSMEPGIRTGSVVAVKPADEYRIGDVITFRTGRDEPTTHRIVEIRNENGSESYVTKGDANNAPDSSAVRENEIIGKVLFSVPYAGYAVDVARKPIGFVLIIVIPALIIIGDEVRKIFLEVKRMRQGS
jgi:signal peptidase